MLPPPPNNNPWQGTNNPAVPPVTAGVFVAWGWMRDLINTAIPSAVADFNYYATVSPGVFV